jgi:DNA polymerase III epsilon subunit-like protein
VSTIVFVDCETTSLRPDRRAWDIALIVREDGEEDVEHQWFIDADDLDLGNADPFSLRIGHFYERHPAAGTTDFFVPNVESEHFVMRQVEHWTRGAHLVGSVPNFDADVLGTRMRANGILPSWHYHLQDVETLIVGYIRGLIVATAEQLDAADKPTDALRQLPTALPWNSEDLSRAVGVEPPSGEDRHTAIGDARWARDMFDAVMGKSAS